MDTTPPAIALKAHASGATDTVTLTVGQTWEDPGIDITDADTGAWYVSSRDYIPNQLDMYGFMENGLVDADLNFNNNGGILQETPLGHTNLNTAARASVSTMMPTGSACPSA